MKSILRLFLRYNLIVYRLIDFFFNDPILFQIKKLSQTLNYAMKQKVNLHHQK